MLKDRDRAILQKIVVYCQQIEQTVARFGADFETYCADHVYRNACCMCILQIGELVGKLSGELTAACPNIPWRSIRATRNLFAHAYGNVSATIREDIPELRENCRKILASGETEGDRTAAPAKFPQRP